MNKLCHIVLAILFFAVIPLVFAEDFQNRPTLSGLNEVVNQAIVCGKATIERDTVVSRNQNFFPYCGHGQSYFAFLQQELESLAPMYVDHVNGPLNPEETVFLYLTIDSWREAAELNEDGFQRFDSDGNFIGYGFAQSNDGILPTVFDELQAGFGALKWTLETTGSVVNGLQKSGGGQAQYTDCETACENATADFYTKDWTSSTMYLYCIHGQIWHDFVTHYAYTYRAKGAHQITNISICCPHSAVFYVLASYTADADNLFGENNKYCIWQDFGEETISTRTTSIFGDIESSPLELFAISYSTCSFINGGTVGATAVNPRWLLKWNFTH